MSVSTNYATPVQVNGFTCRNCTDVDYAKKHIDPAHPKSGPYGIDAKSDPTRAPAPKSTDAVRFGGSLGALNTLQAGAQAGSSAAAASAGTTLDIAA